ncbi:hypothetical protein QZH41_004505 [Actinostola sp. cb2023]|nr:hypothetical protein QZH41_004505 [Actinostola sp. cb2023]
MGVPPCLPTSVEATTDPKDKKWDGVVLVCENLDWECDAIDFLKKPIQEAQKVHAPTGPVNRDYDDVRRYSDAAVEGIKRAIKAGSKSPLLVVPSPNTFHNAWAATVLGVLHGLYVPIEIREDVPDRKEKVDHLGVFLQATEDLDYVSALESGRLVCRDIGGSDPERMAAPNVAKYVSQVFHGTAVKVSITHVDSIEKDYPLMAAVNRAAKGIKRHQGRLIQLEYVGEGTIDQTLLLVGKGITYDTGGADIKAGGVMAGMHRDKCGASAVAGFFQVLAKLKPKGIKVLGKLAMALNEINPHIITIATLTGHAVVTVGEGYSIVMDNGPAAKKKFAKKIQAAGHAMGDPFEISTIRREDYNFAKGKSEYEDVLQCNNQPSSRTPRGHQFPGAFLIRASGLDKHGIDSDQPIPYSHIDIAASSGPFPGVPSGSPVVALAEYFLRQPKQDCCCH